MLSLTDLFCGAGGSSLGAAQVPGVRVVACANHWQRAIDVHQANHPDALHMCADVSLVNPRTMPKTDAAWISPSCTNHSQARGVARRVMDAQPDLFGEVLPDEAAERSRATMWDVPRWSEVHQYRAVIVENVLEAAQWPPFRAWLLAMDSYGYAHQILSINSMHAQIAGLPAPQSRDRLYVVFWRKGDRAPDLEAVQRPQAWCPRCEQLVAARKSWKNGRTVGRYRAQYLFVCPTPRCGQLVEPGWLPASSAIDWTIRGTRIGERSKPLAAKTRARIAAGIARYWRPFTLEAAGNTFERRPGVRTWPCDEVLTTLTTSQTKALAVPVEGRDGVEARPMTRPMRTQTARLETGILTPFIAELRGGGSDARSVTDPLATVTASGTHHGLVTPYYGTSDTAAPTSAPIGTVTTRDRHALVTPSGGTWTEDARPADYPHRTLSTREAYAVVTPGDLEAAAAEVDECLFRMLEPSECAKAMAFSDDYIWSGTRRERVRMAGNAVTPPVARDLMTVVAAALGGDGS